MSENRELKKIIAEDNKVLKGSAYLSSKSVKKIDRESFMYENMSQNLSFKEAKKNEKGCHKALLNNFKERYKNYRRDWNLQPQKCIDKKLSGEELTEKNIRPLCVDIEVAAICDLACPFCYREFIVTPDKIIDDKLCYSLIDQAADLKVPSMKFNWRGEPLLNPKIYDYIRYAKKKGILETIINTNATNLTEKNSRKLIEAGLDLVIYSFDGGSKKTYEKMRPGRFKENSFNKVYSNIKNFKKIRDELKLKLPYTKIQMILTKETSHEIDSFFDLFNEYVDDVSVNQYSERGGEISDLNDADQIVYSNLIKKYNLPQGTPYMKNVNGKLSVSKGREACKQPYQRLLVTYEGKVAMCCYDWGANHTIGYSDEKAFNNSADYEQIEENVKNKKKGFELLKDIKPGKKWNTPEKKVETLKSIWVGKEIDKVRKQHCEGKGDNVAICKKCTFKDVYKWS
jgi:MoaA/NifB/PqqE/SkfB family radical SAM enzyme